ncbi:hypothetical protein GTGU_03603 [Trabulsiella guamensis ATCC 49490]|uniref:Uncharacterized protein n=1 Tax=Trabulsiella guamensis ATCC 49490 TaxID=1005994 RepID=A0A084ZUE1_9ENTR|nr:hypothetical protein [Trabulsiella guamensis]KFC01086.1 hypothetical protein GTGU_03603 [Trabulsiella guamensis ATCC 49490]
MHVNSIKLTTEISDPEFVAISLQARKAERANLLGLLRTRISLLKTETSTPDEIYAAIDAWIDNRELSL